VRLGISGLALGNPTGLGRLSRVYVLALAECAPDWELHVYVRRMADLQCLRDECDRRSEALVDRLVVHRAPAPWLNRLILEELDLPRQFAPLRLDAYLGCDFTLPGRRLAPREFAVVPDLLPFTRPGTVSWRARFLYRRGIRRCLRRQATLLCISRHTADAFARLFPRAAPRTAVVRPTLSPRLWQLARAERHGDHPPQVQGTLHRLSAPGPYILAVGTAGSRKNTPLLVDVYREVVMRGDYRGSLVLVGGNGRFHTAPDGQRLALETAGAAWHETRTSAEVYDLGRVNDYDLSQLYHHADLLVNLSSEEGFGFPVLEALAHGVPALVTAGSSMTEIADRGIAATPLERAECGRRLISALHALPLLRQEAAGVPEEQYSLERLGSDLVQVLSGGATDAA
jgi:glycosyltransferase involved in cell wall biosynthesis